MTKDTVIPEMQGSQPTHRGIENWKMYAIKQIKSVQNTGTMNTKPRTVFQVHLSFGLSASTQVTDKPAFALDAMSRYSAPILICISKLHMTGLLRGNPPINSPHKGPGMLKAFPRHDAFMVWSHSCTDTHFLPLPRANYLAVAGLIDSELQLHS